MNREKAKNARVLGWFCVGLSIVILAIFILKSLFAIAADGDASPALLIIGIVLFIAGITGLARAKKAL